jgi:cytochrome c oxidase subunit 3
LINTVILLTSGATVTFGHHFLLRGDRKEGLLGAFLTVIAALIFTTLQYIEYAVSSFTISDGIYGSSFFFSTGFHGLHVIIGTVFIGVGLIRLYNYQLTDSRHLGYECGIIY